MRDLSLYIFIFSSDTDVKIINTYVKDFFSFCTVIDQTNILNKIRLQISSCYFEDVQDGVKMILHPASEVNIQVDKLKLELDLLDVEMQSNGIHISGMCISMHFTPNT